MKKLTLIITVIAAIGISSCKKGFLDESVNPNSPSTSSLALSLTSAEKGAADIVNGWGSYTGTDYMYAPYGVWAGYWVQNPNGYIANPIYYDYQIQTTTTNLPWSDLYDNLANLNILEVNSTGTNANYEAIAKVMKAYDFEQLVDNYNNVPYSQAFQGAKNFTPAYDSGTSIYADLIKQMDAAIALINGATTQIPPGSDDIIFGGNMTSWKKFANTMKLRLIMRQSNLPTFAGLKVELANTAAEGYLDGSTQAEANPGYALSDSYGGQESPFYREYGIDPNGSTTLYGNSYFVANSFCVNLMVGLNDTVRVKLFYTPVGDTVTSAYQGSTVTPPVVSTIGSGLLNPTQNAVLFSGAESLFLQAEAANDGMIPGTASTLYNAGITASFAKLGLSSTQAAAYYGQPGVSLTTSGNVEQSIITQKYIALNGFGVFEAYNEYRRTGYPDLPRSKASGALGTGLPTRIFYPQIEYNTNPGNVGQQPSATVATEFGSKIFWAK